MRGALAIIYLWIGFGFASSMSPTEEKPSGIEFIGYSISWPMAAGIALGDYVDRIREENTARNKEKLHEQ